MVFLGQGSLKNKIFERASLGAEWAAILKNKIFGCRLRCKSMHNRSRQYRWPLRRRLCHRQDNNNSDEIAAPFPAVSELASCQPFSVAGQRSLGLRFVPLLHHIFDQVSGFANVTWTPVAVQLPGLTVDHLTLDHNLVAGANKTAAGKGHFGHIGSTLCFGSLPHNATRLSNPLRLGVGLQCPRAAYQD